MIRLRRDDDDLHDAHNAAGNRYGPNLIAGREGESSHPASRRIV
jgi:hypothetical protein